MTAPKPNAELAYRVLDHIDAHPEQHRQKWWFTVLKCGTAGCFAGWTSIMSGDRPLVELADDEGEFSSVETPSGERFYVEERAIELLGIDDEQAANLFHEYNTREDLGRLVAEIFGPRPASCPCADGVPSDQCSPHGCRPAGGAE